MKKRIKLILITFLIITGLITLHFFCGLFTPYNYITAKWDISHNQPRVLVYDETMVTDEQAIKLAPKFGFTYANIAYCNVGTPLVNGIDAYNSVTTKYLNDKYGNGWRKKFDFSVDSLFRIDRVDTIRKTILAIPYVRHMERYLDSISNGKLHLYIWVLPQQKDGPNVRVSQIMPDCSIKVFDYYQVDPYDLMVSTIQY